MTVGLARWRVASLCRLIARVSLGVCVGVLLVAFVGCEERLERFEPAEPGSAVESADASHASDRVTGQRPETQASLELDRVKEATTKPEVGLVPIMLTREGDIRVEDDGWLELEAGPVTPDALEAALREKVEAGWSPEVELRADADADYADVIALMEVVMQAGVQNVSIATSRR